MFDQRPITSPQQYLPSTIAAILIAILPSTSGCLAPGERSGENLYFLMIGRNALELPGGYIMVGGGIG